MAVFNSCINFGIYVVFTPHLCCILLTDVLKLSGSRRSRHRRGQVDGGTGRSRDRVTEVRTSVAIMNCAKKCTTAAATPSSVATASGQAGSRETTDLRITPVEDTAASKQNASPLAHLHRVQTNSSSSSSSSSSYTKPLR